MADEKTKKTKRKTRAPPGVTAKRNQNARRAATKAKREAKELTELSSIEYKRAKLTELRGDIEMCRHTGRVTALAQLHKIEMQTQEELEQCRKEEADPLESMGPEELLAFIRNIVIALPPVLQDQLAATLGAVRARNVVRLDTPPHDERDRNLKIPGTKTRGSR